jgi:hypothetical protein
MQNNERFFAVQKETLSIVVELYNIYSVFKFHINFGSREHELRN